MERYDEIFIPIHDLDDDWTVYVNTDPEHRQLHHFVQFKMFEKENETSIAHSTRNWKRLSTDTKTKNFLQARSTRLSPSPKVSGTGKPVNWRRPRLKN